MLLHKFPLSAKHLKFILNLYPPYLGAGIRVTHLSNDFRHATVEMPLTFYNKNVVGVHFGGSLYSMCDPMYMLMLLNILDKSEYIVWDKAASIEYKKPAKSRVRAEFRLEDDVLESIYAMEPQERKFIDLLVHVTDEENDVVAVVTKTEYIKRKGPAAATHSTTSERVQENNSFQDSKIDANHSPSPSRPSKL